MRQILQNYRFGMAVYDRCHPPTVTSQWQALRDEIAEFMGKPSPAEAWDILHSLGRLVFRVTRIPLHLLAWQTVCKHSQRYAEYGCIRSRRNCERKCCHLGDRLMEDQEED